MTTGTLYLIPTNLSEPITASAVLPADALAVVRRLQHFVVENAKIARAFLGAVGVATPIRELHIQEVNAHTPSAAISDFIAPLLAGYDVGLLSDAGAPGVADPGAELVALAHDRRIRVSPMIGPSAILLALMASGLNGQRFMFHGYLPQETLARAAAISSLETESRKQNLTQLFIETPYRNQVMLTDLLRVLSPRTRLAVAIDLTGNGERIVSKTVKDWRLQASPLEKKPAMFLFLA